MCVWVVETPDCAGTHALPTPQGSDGPGPGWLWQGAVPGPGSLQDSGCPESRPWPWPVALLPEQPWSCPKGVLVAAVLSPGRGHAVHGRLLPVWKQEADLGELRAPAGPSATVRGPAGGHGLGPGDVGAVPALRRPRSAGWGAAGGESSPAPLCWRRLCSRRASRGSGTVAPAPSPQVPHPWWQQGVQVPLP